MPTDRWGVLKVGGAEPAQFMIFWIDLELPKGRFMQTSDFLTEVELRSELVKMERTHEQIDLLIDRARANPV
jgi:hypothetical protein